MKKYFKMTNSAFTDQWVTMALDVKHGFSSEDFCKTQSAIEITRAEYNKLIRQFEKTGKMLKADVVLKYERRKMNGNIKNALNKK